MQLTKYFRNGIFMIPLCVCGGCVSPATFTQPCQVIAKDKTGSCTASAPATQATVVFNSNFDPSGSLHVTYDGTDVTGMLQPPPSPGGSSNVAIPQPPGGYPAGASHTMTINDTCGFFCVYPTITMTFTPPTLNIFAPSPGQNAPVVGSIAVPTQATFVDLSVPAGAGGTTVTLTASPAIVNFKTTPTDPGGPSLPVVIGPGGFEGSFYVQAIPGQTVGTPFTVTGTASGFQVGTRSGSIQLKSPG